MRFHYLPVPADVRWQRVSGRNHARGATYSLAVNRGMFDFCERLFEEPTPAELQGAAIVT